MMYYTNDIKYSAHVVVLRLIPRYSSLPSIHLSKIIKNFKTYSIVE